jgi:hypothetical protein
MANKAEASVQLSKQSDLLLQTSIQAGRPTFLSAASGLVCCDKHFFVVADDELHLGIFPIDHSLPGSAWPLLAGQLPIDKKLRKQQKPDFEVLAYIPSTSALGTSALLVLGSGSRANRNIGLLLPLNPDDSLHKNKFFFDLTPLYSALESEFDIVNIEGAVVQHNQLLLLQRGNKKAGINAIIVLDLIPSIVAMLSGAIDTRTLRSIQSIELGSRAGVALGFTDAICLPDGQLLALAVAEDTDDPYTDGQTFGSYLCRFDAHNQLQAMTKLITAAKTEGVALWRQSLKENTLAFVTDADDPNIPASLLTASLDAFI